MAGALPFSLRGNTVCGLGRTGWGLRPVLRWSLSVGLMRGLCVGCGLPLAFLEYGKELFLGTRIGFLATIKWLLSIDLYT